MHSNSLLSLAEEFSFGSSGSYYILMLQHWGGLPFLGFGIYYKHLIWYGVLQYE